MTDPAISAAQRAWNDNGKSAYSMVAINAAREALKPIRAWYFAAMAYNATIDDLAPLIFTTEELER